MTNLVETIMGALPANTGDALGTMLGDNPDASVKGLSAILPLVLAAFAGKAASGADLGGLVSTISNGLSGGNPLDNPAALLSGSPPAATGIGGLASQILGSNMVPIAAAVAAMFGLKGGTVNSLLALAGPLVVGGIGKALGGAPSVHGLRNLLASEKDSYAQMLPAELRQLVAPVAPVAPVAAAAPEAAAASSGLWKWLLLGLALLGLLWWFFGRTPKVEPVPAPAPVEQAAVEAAPVVPTGSGVRTEERAGRPVLVVFFDVAKSDVSADLAPSSAAVKAYYDSHPDARISVSGFNDPTGDAAANAELSKSRAEQVKAALVAAGFAADRVDLDKPAAATDSSESYAAARRVEVTVKE